MKTHSTITDITHEDLVNLLSTATFGSNWIDIYYDKNQVEEQDGDCWEDIAARVLLFGGEIELLDYLAEDEDDKYSDTAKWDGRCMSYPITLTDIYIAFERILNGNLKDDDNECAQRCLRSFMDDCTDFDLIKADVLIQIIMFGELIYG